MTRFDPDFFRQHLPGVAYSLEPEALEAYGHDWTHLREPAPSAVLWPADAGQVQQTVQCARREGVAIVPSGGRTGLSGGAVAADGEWVLSLDKLREMGDPDPVNGSIRVGAGVATGAVQGKAADAGLFYPVDFSASGSSQIGGNIATNAGGIRVLRYGLTREQVLGLTAVTGSGELLELNHGLVKNATGYDFRHLLVGSEGTLAIITAAEMKLLPAPAPATVMLFGLSGHEALMPLFSAARRALRLSAFEFFSHPCVEHVCAEASLSPPLDEPCPYYALLEFDGDPEGGEQAALGLFEQAMEAGWASDGAVSQSEGQAQDLWAYRERISESIAARRPYKNDIAVRIADVPDFLAELDEIVKSRYPDFEVLWYGHIGDGNLHMNVLSPESMDYDRFLEACEEVSRQVFESIGRHNGSISAEHGVGILKRPYLHYSRSEPEIELMRAVKESFDPDGILNPGKLL